MLPFVLTIILVYGPTVMCDTKASKIEPSSRSWGGSSSKDRNAFFALRSCHQILHGDSGEFFSPDYLCSNPPLWCNWTIKVPAGKRVHLRLEDFTPASTCHLKTDQIHLDESAAGGGLGPALSGSVSTGNHRILEKCWGKAEYTSLSGTTHVILLIPRTPDPPLRGFYGRFSSLGDGLQGETDELPKNDAKDAENVSDSGSHEKQEPPDMYGNYGKTVPPPLPEPISGSKETSSASVNPKISYSLDQNNSPDTKTAGGSHFVSPGPISMSNEIPPGPEHRGGERAENGGNTWRTLKTHSVGDAEGGREGEEEGVDVALGRPRASDAHSAMVTERKMKKKADRPHADSPGTVAPSPLTVANSPLFPITPQLVSTTVKTTATNTTLRQVDAYIPTPKAEAAKKVVTKASFKERTYLHQAPRNRTHHPHLPGEFLFEMSVEVVFGHQAGESWDQGVATLLTSLKNTIKEELLRNAPKSLSSKRIKRLSSGALFLLWLHVGEWQEGPLTHRVLHAAAQGLRGRSLLQHGGGTEAVIAHVSVTDVNECGTQLAQCDTNAECVNHFGTYACRCLPSYVDKSRTGPGGTVCIDPAATACSWSSPAILRGIYCICFLLSFLIALLLLTLAAVYRRRHQGAFLLRCQGHSNGSGLATVAGGGGAADDNNNVSDPNGGAGGRRGGCMRMSAVRNRPLPPAPPTPPTRHPKEGSDDTGSLQPPTLRLGPLSHSDGSGTLALESSAKQ